jgi:hypothetical protein
MSTRPFERKFMKLSVLTAALLELTPRALRERACAASSGPHSNPHRRRQSRTMAKQKLNLAMISDGFMGRAHPKVGRQLKAIVRSVGSGRWEKVPAS